MDTSDMGPGAANDSQRELSEHPFKEDKIGAAGNQASTEHLRNAEHFPTEHSHKDRVLDGLDDLLSGPRAARLVSGTLIVLVAIVVTVGQVSDFIERRKANQQLGQHQTDDYRSAAGTHDSSKDNAQGAAAAQKQTAQEVHLNKHIALHDGKPVILPRDVLAALGGVDVVSIQYFTSDSCIFVHRHRGNIETDDWLADSTQRVQKSSSAEPSPEILLASVLPLEKVLAADEIILDERYPQPRLVRVQGGRCINPHGGPFNWWWGAPNGCWVPMMRQFQDGCLHHQMFNSCANYWDANIFWDRCVH